MNSGIYLLTFTDGSQYVGQAQDMETRWKQHADKFRKGQAAKKMQAAYDSYGMPTAKVLIKCHKDYLDILEGYYIHQYSNNLNTNIPKLDNSVDYDTLLANKDMLQYSTVELMQGFISVAKEVVEYKAPFDAKLAEATALANIKAGHDTNENLAKVYKAAYERVSLAIIKLRDRGLLARIFNTD